MRALMTKLPAATGLSLDSKHCNFQFSGSISCARF